METQISLGRITAPPILQEWLLLRQRLTGVKNFSIARCLSPDRQSSVQHVELRMFSDASVIRCDDAKSCHLIASKQELHPLNHFLCPD